MLSRNLTLKPLTPRRVLIRSATKKTPKKKLELEHSQRKKAILHSNFLISCISRKTVNYVTFGASCFLLLSFWVITWIGRYSKVNINFSVLLHLCFYAFLFR